MPETPWTQPTWDSFECWSSLTHWAGAFPSYRFGTIVLANSFRSPALLAKMAATTQIRQLEEAVQVIRALWTETPASFAGRYYRLENAYCEPKPDPLPPIMIG